MDFEVIDGVSLDREWIKWLSYVPEFKKERLDMLNNKMVKDVSLEELKEIRKYKKQIRALELLEKYNNEEISKEEQLKVYYFLRYVDIMEFMLSNLSFDEVLSARDKIRYYSEYAYSELKSEINKLKEDYDNLSMVDSYLLHELSIIYNKKNNLDNKVVKK